MKRLNGWQRLWVLLSLIYSIPVAVVALLQFPTTNESYHTDDFYRELRKESLSKLVISPSKSKSGGSFIDPDDIGTQVEMPNGHLLPFKKGVTDDEMRTVAREYHSITERATLNRRLRIVGYSLLAWITPCVALYLVGVGIAWVRRGFRSEGAP